MGARAGLRTGGFRRADRLLRPREFRHVTRHGRRAAVRGFVLYAVESAREAGRPVPAGPGGAQRPPPRPRLGLTVSRRVGNAVARNRVKRRVREWFRCARAGFPEPWDLVVVGRPSASELSGREVAERLDEAVAQLRRAA